MKNATMFYIHPGKKKLHGIDVNTVIADGLNDNVVNDLFAKGYRRTPLEALAAYQDAQKPVDKGPVPAQPAPQADEAPVVAPKPSPAPQKRPGRPKKVS